MCAVDSVCFMIRKSGVDNFVSELTKEKEKVDILG